MRIVGNCNNCVCMWGKVVLWCDTASDFKIQPDERWPSGKVGFVHSGCMVHCCVLQCQKTAVCCGRVIKST